jgi:hypothetical protein
MPTKSRGTADEPPIPGGDPDQPANDIPAPARPNNREIEDKEKSGYGHTGNREEVPVPEGAPEPHQIF